MRVLRRLAAVVALIALAGWAMPPLPAFAGNLDTTADRVFGQLDFVSHTAGLSANSLAYPAGVALDAQDNLYVADDGSDRVLEYNRALVKLSLPLLER